MKYSEDLITGLVWYSNSNIGFCCGCWVFKPCSDKETGFEWHYGILSFEYTGHDGPDFML